MLDIETKKFKPVVFIKGQYNYHRQNTFQQGLLLKALQVTTDPQELRKMAGLKTVAEVYRTLDKLSLRKEYHEALARQGISFDMIISGIRDVCDKADNTSKGLSVKLKGLQTLLRSLGVDEYKENIEGTGKSWEDMLVELADKKDDDPKQLNQPIEYEVKVPDVPMDAIKKMEEEEESSSGLYG